MRSILAGLILVSLVGFPGCGALEAVDGFRIQGTWVGTNGGKLIFYSDNTCDISGRAGKYQVLAENRLKITTKGLLWGENEEIVTYKINSSTSIKLNAKILGFDVSDTFTKQ
jgi:hypothetical protein